MPITDNALRGYAQRIGQQIRGLRKAKRLTLPALAELAGLNNKFLGSVERGETTLTVSRLIQIAEALEVPVSIIVEPCNLSESSMVPQAELISLISKNLRKLSPSDLLALYRYSAFLLVGVDTVDTAAEEK